MQGRDGVVRRGEVEATSHSAMHQGNGSVCDSYGEDGEGDGEREREGQREVEEEKEERRESSSLFVLLFLDSLPSLAPHQCCRTMSCIHHRKPYLSPPTSLCPIFSLSRLAESMNEHFNVDGHRTTTCRAGEER